jgi:hypothetical protein
MLVQGIEWIGERVHIHLFDTDGRHETVILYPAEALDILGWLHMQHKELLRLNEKHLDEIRREENVS